MGGGIVYGSVNLISGRTYTIVTGTGGVTTTTTLGAQGSVAGTDTTFSESSSGFTITAYGGPLNDWTSNTAPNSGTFSPTTLSTISVYSGGIGGNVTQLATNGYTMGLTNITPVVVIAGTTTTGQFAIYSNMFTVVNDLTNFPPGIGFSGAGGRGANSTIGSRAGSGAIAGDIAGSSTGNANGENANYGAGGGGAAGGATTSGKGGNGGNGFMYLYLDKQ